MNICQETLPHPKASKLTLGLWLDFPLLILLAHKYSTPQTLNRLNLACYSVHFPNCNSSAISK